jgi:hypothetical protein
VPARAKRRLENDFIRNTLKDSNRNIKVTFLSLIGYRNRNDLKSRSTFDMTTSFKRTALHGTQSSLLPQLDLRNKFDH